MFRFGITLAVVMLTLSTAVAGDSKYIMNFDLIVKLPASDEVVYSHQLQGISFLSEQPFHGRDLGEFDYFLTIADAEGGKGKLTIEFYLYETRKHESEVLAELVSEVSFGFGSPVTFESKNDKFSVNLAFSVIQK